MKTNLLFSFIFLAQLLSAQTFTEVMGTSFEGVRAGSIAFSDVDGDNDEDLLVTGSTNSLPPYSISKLYINDGLGNFSEVLDTPFEGVELGSIAFSDVDGDNDQDLLITGESSSNVEISKLYINDGLGNFSEVMGTPFEDIFIGSIAFSDVDGDNDQDLLITGFGTSNAVSKLYSNDGLGNFSEVIGTPFDAIYQSSIAFSDVDGDNDQDLLITGRTDSDIRISKLYINDGQGNFSEVIGTPFDGVALGSIAFSDVDGDNDQDLLITGSTDSDIRVSKLYSNDGQGNFSEVMETPFEGVWGGSVAFSDVDGDNDQDLFITGIDSSFARISKLYINESVVSIENVISELNFEFKLYPNPTKANTINISYDSKESTWVDVNIFDLEGRLLKQHKEQIGIGEQTFSINISSLNKGAYTIQLDDDVRTGSQKFVVE